MNAQARPPAGPNTVLMVGLTSAGKTSFLAALWYSLTETQLDTELALDRLPGNLEFFNKLMNAWLNCEEADHTSRAGTTDVVLRLREGQAPPFDLAIPDYSGELVEEAWVKRRWPYDMKGFVQNAGSVVLLIHPQFVFPRVTLAEAGAYANAIEAGAPDETRAPEPFDLSKVPTQTMLVEFLQFVRARAKAKQLPIAAIVSAWDLVESEELSPPAWLEARLPLLHQFLVANGNSLPSTVFGLSAQGADWRNNRAGCKEVHPRDRAFLVLPDGTRAKDISSPIAWATAPS